MGEWIEEEWCRSRDSRLGGIVEKEHFQMTIHRFQPDPDVPDYCQCGGHRLNNEHGLLDVEALPDLYKACKELREVVAVCFRAIAEANGRVGILNHLTSEFKTLGIKDGFGVRAEAAIKKAEGR